MIGTAQTQPSMLRLLLTYTGVLILAIALCYFGLRIWWQQTGQGFPVIIMLYLVPILAALQAAKQYVKQKQKRASILYSLVFGTLATVVILAVVLGAWQMDWLDEVLARIDPSAMRHDNEMRPLQTLLVMLGGLGLFCNVAMFWAGTAGDARRLAKLAEKAEAAHKG